MAVIKMKPTSPGQRAVQIWGIWRNGDPIDMNFFTDYKLEWSLLSGKNRSAVEVLSCFVMHTRDEAPVDAARRALATAFHYHRPTPTATPTPVAARVTPATQAQP